MTTLLYKLVIIIMMVFSFSSGFAQQLVPEDEIKAIDNVIKSKGNPGKTIVLDGIIEPDKWYASDYRILFVLKEPWGGNNKELVDIRSVNRDAKVVPEDRDGGETYRPMVAIANMLVKDIENYNAVSGSIYGSEAWSVFKGCSAIVEVKKIYGGSSSDKGEIRAHARNNAILLKDQIRVYNPNVVIIGLDNLLDGILINDDAGGYKVFGEDVKYNDVKFITIRDKEFKCYYTDNRIYINAFHPSYVGSNRAKKYLDEYCEEIVRVAREWMEDNEE